MGLLRFPSLPERRFRRFLGMLLLFGVVAFPLGTSAQLGPTELSPSGLSLQPTGSQGLFKVFISNTLGGTETLDSESVWAGLQAVSPGAKFSLTFWNPKAAAPQSLEEVRSSTNTITVTGEDEMQAFAEAAAAFKTKDPSTQQARADNILGITREKSFNPLDYVGNAFLVILDYALTIILWVIGILMTIAGKFVDFMLSVSTLAGAPVVEKGWTFTRDSLNFVFILSLLAIAFSTIAGIEGYGMRQLLPRLLVAALLVNFSLAIAGGFLQVANVLCTTAIRGLGAEARCGGKSAPGSGPGTSLTLALAESASIKEQYTIGTSEFLSDVIGFEVKTFERNQAATQINFEASFTENIGTILRAAMTVIFAALFTVALIVLAAMLGVRLAVLVILLVLAPVPYVFSIIPRASQYAEKWWNTFIQYTFFLPVVVFFLVLAVGMVQGAGDIAKQLGADPEALASGKTSQAILMATFNTFFISAFIMVAIFVAKTMGILGSQAAIGFATRATKGAVGLGTYPGRFAWARTGAPVIETFKAAQKEQERVRRAGLFGRLGTYAATPLMTPRGREQVKRQMENEDVKRLKDEGRPLTQLNLKRPVEARYAAEADLLDAADAGQRLQALQTLGDAGRMGSPAYNKARKLALESLPLSGAEIAARIERGNAQQIASSAWERLSGRDSFRAYRREFERTPSRNVLTELDVTGPQAAAIWDYGANEDHARLLASARLLRGARFEIERRRRMLGEGGGGPRPTPGEPGRRLDELGFGGGVA